jgi:hypothetical protein
VDVDCLTHFFLGRLAAPGAAPQPVDDGPTNAGTGWLALDDIPAHFGYHRVILGAIQTLLARVPP